MKDLTPEILANMSEGERLVLVLEILDAVLPLLPLDHFRALVTKGESIIGRGELPLPSGTPFDKQTRKGRLILDLVDRLKQLDEEYR